jgi:hypothetical protein
MAFLTMLELPSIEVDVGDFRPKHPHVAVPLEDCAQRTDDLAGRKRPGRDLVGQRLEEVKVSPVMSVTSRRARRRRSAAWSPPNPPPTITRSAIPGCGVSPLRHYRD